MFGYGKKRGGNNKGHQQNNNGNNETGLLYYKVGKDGVITNLQAWLRGWKETKINEYDVSFQEALRTYQREQYDLEDELKKLEYLPLVMISKDFWVPTADQINDLAAQADPTLRGYMERRMMADWAEEQAKTNAEIKAKNDTIKKQRDEIVAKGNEAARKNVITGLMGKVLADMTVESRRMIQNWKRTEPKDPADPLSALMADNIEEAYQKYDWLFVFEAAMVTHLHADSSIDGTAILERQELAQEKLKSLKHEGGSIQAWLQRFDDAVEECETMGATITDETKRIYLMRNLNEKIFEQTLVLWRGVLTRKTFPDKYDALKAYIANEYSSQMTQPERAKVIYAVISAPWKKRTEQAMLSKEGENGGKDKDSCFICERKGHKEKKCWYYDATKTREQNRKKAQEKIKEKQEARKKKQAEKKEDGPPTTPTTNGGGVPHKGTIAQLPPKTELAGLCKITEEYAGLYCEPCNAAGVRPGQIDFIYDSGTVNGVMGEKERAILKNVAEEDVLIETVTGEKSISKLYGDTVFGKTRILNGRKGSVLVSQYATKKMYQVLNPDEDTFVLRGWDHNPATKGKVWYFVRDEDRYDDKLLHCTISLKEAKCFGATKEQNFYDPKKAPEEEKHAKMNVLISTIHQRWDHASSNELKNILKIDKNMVADGITTKDIDNWYVEKGRFCSGCVEGKMKEHARVKSKKPLKSDVPGEVTVGDIMFVEMKDNRKQPLLIHTDVCTKLITGQELGSKSGEECTKGILNIKHDYSLYNRIMKQLVFDREPAVIPTEATLKSEGIELVPKAAGQKVGLAEVSIRLVRNKARATKAGVREKYGYLPPNQFNMDLCLDSIQVLNRIPKENCEESPYELFTGRKIDVLRDFRADWGEPVIVKKPKGIASDLHATGQWGVVVRRVMNGTGVIKVYLIQSKRYAFRLNFQRAIPPEWVLDALNNINLSTNIGFEDGEPETIAELETPAQVTDAIDAIELEDEVEFIGGPEHATVVHKSIDSIEDVWKQEIKQELNEEIVEEEVAKSDATPMIAITPSQPDVYITRSGRVSRPPDRLIESAYAVVKEQYVKQFQDADPESINKVTETIEVCGMMKALLFQKAVKEKPEEATKALREEVTKAIKIKIWEPVHLNSLSEEEKGLIIPQMINYLEKYKPDMSFDKYKVRVLTRGDKQWNTGESEGPVVRVESLYMLLSIAAFENYEVFKVDIGSAFMRTPMVDDVKHKWVKLDKRVVQLLCELQPGKYEPYVLPDGSVIVEMKAISYGFVEAAHYWWKGLTETFKDNGYSQGNKDKCVYIKREGDKVAYCGVTVDDCFFVTSRHDNWKDQQINMLKNKYEEITVEDGDELGLIGIQIKMDRENKRVILTQRKNIERIINSFKTTKGAPTPAMVNLMGDDDESPKLHDQREFLSKCSMLMFVSQRTYPEIRPATVKLSTKYNKATELDMQKAHRVAEYIYGSKDVHCLILAPKSMKLVASADAAYAEHTDAKSHSGGTVGFESDTACHFAFVSSKQPVIAKSSGEAELIAENKVADTVEWAREALEELGYPQGKVPMLVDSTCAMQMVKQGTGSFKRAKHIKVRFFWLKDLLDQGLLELIYTPTDELVADILTKPLTGWKFYYLLGKLLGNSKLTNE